MYENVNSFPLLIHYTGDIGGVYIKIDKPEDIKSGYSFTVIETHFKQDK